MTSWKSVKLKETKEVDIYGCDLYIWYASSYKWQIQHRESRMALSDLYICWYGLKRTSSVKLKMTYLTITDGVTVQKRKKNIHVDWNFNIE